MGNNLLTTGGNSSRLCLKVETAETGQCATGRGWVCGSRDTAQSPGLHSWPPGCVGEHRPSVAEVGLEPRMALQPCSRLHSQGQRRQLPKPRIIFGELMALIHLSSIVHMCPFAFMSRSSVSVTSVYCAPTVCPAQSPAAGRPKVHLGPSEQGKELRAAAGSIPHCVRGGMSRRGQRSYPLFPSPRPQRTPSRKHGKRYWAALVTLTQADQHLRGLPLCPATHSESGLSVLQGKWPPLLHVSLPCDSLVKQHGPWGWELSIKEINKAYSVPVMEQ